MLEIFNTFFEIKNSLILGQSFRDFSLDFNLECIKSPSPPKKKKKKNLKRILFFGYSNKGKDL